jgi:vanillate O-demethylase monooxygenase subunit
LSLGRRLGDDIECAYHGFTFNSLGACVHIPHQTTVPRAAKVQSYAVAERWGYIWLWFGASEKADFGRVPHLPWIEDSKFRTVYFHFDVKANFQLMADNLMDVSHTEFLHRATIGSQTGRKGRAVVQRRRRARSLGATGAKHSAWAHCHAMGRLR